MRVGEERAVEEERGERLSIPKNWRKVSGVTLVWIWCVCGGREGERGGGEGEGEGERRIWGGGEIGVTLEEEAGDVGGEELEKRYEEGRVGEEGGEPEEGEGKDSR